MDSVFSFLSSPAAIKIGAALYAVAGAVSVLTPDYTIAGKIAHWVLTAGIFHGVAASSRSDKP